MTIVLTPRRYGKYATREMPTREKHFFNMPRPAADYDLSRLLPDMEIDGDVKKGFETLKRTREEDEKRIRTLRHHASPHALDLAARLEHGLDYPEPKPTMASKCWMMEFRRRYLGEVLRTFNPYEDDELFQVTLVSDAWRVPLGKLHKFSAGHMMESFRQHLGRCGATKAPGVLHACIHGDLLLRYNVYRIHIHVMCTREKMECLLKLKERAAYEKSTSNARPIFVKKIKKPSKDGEHFSRRRALSYTFQSFWPSRTRSGSFVLKDRVRLPFEAEVEFLLWMDQQRPSEFTLSQPNIRMKCNRG